MNRQDCNGLESMVYDIHYEEHSFKNKLKIHRKGVIKKHWDKGIFKVSRGQNLDPIYHK